MSKIGDILIQGMTEAVESIKNCKGCERRRKKIKELQEQAYTRLVNRATADTIDEKEG